MFQVQATENQDFLNSTVFRVIFIKIGFMPIADPPGGTVFISYVCLECLTKGLSSSFRSWHRRNPTGSPWFRWSAG